MQFSKTGFSDSKEHFLVLDALRGVASIMVVLMHGFEIFCAGNYHNMIINHGYLAVDFFFMLSGYVMAHAYDDRWEQMTTWDFIKRRLIRLHPLIIVGMTLGAALFFFQASATFPKIADTNIIQLIIVMLIGYTILPIPPSMDIRGWNEMHPLNGATWSLFFEYVANLLHVFVLRKLSKIALSILVGMAAIVLVHYLLTGTSGDLIGGWSLEPTQLRIGFTRLLFPYMAGMLLRRMTKPKSAHQTFWPTSILLIAVLSLPRLGGNEAVWINGLYESFVVIFIFPLIIFWGAKGSTSMRWQHKTCTFLGDISYPLYITHFPLIGVYYAWVTNSGISIDQGIWAILFVLMLAILMAYFWLKVYDEPVRKWLAKK